MGKPIIKSLTIRGFKSIQAMENFQLNQLNILIGANGAGKSNFISYFKMLTELVENRLQLWTRVQGEADRLLYFGIKTTKQIESSICFVDIHENHYDFTITPTLDGQFIFEKEILYFDGSYHGVTKPNLGSGHKESKLAEEAKSGKSKKIAKFTLGAISNWKVYHFHDTSDSALVKRVGSLQDKEYLRSDASNLAAFLYHLKLNNNVTYEKICKTVRLAIPFFDDFVLNPQKLPNDEEQIKLLWKQKNSDYPLWPSQLSDGSIRFICLVTALLQPDPPSTIIIDEPELGLHPYAITLLGALIRSAAKRMQVIVSTQSVPLLNEFHLEDLVIVERENETSVFKRLNKMDFSNWLENYSIGELWEKNILGGRPSK
ncbi:AAA family ATPase [Silvanigrella aquatica]|uniref:Recombinase RecF n=1 Tax=Silvanigrella aquatica TaxID=1915309 RepID=A0A1L4CZV7_9BACT|nr:AAA family ATPase [Silvanigrella aquatica]APJ03478.1 recombinase RecF [Silvanigrella aquatica]